MSRLKIVVGVNDLATTRPDYALEWHHEKNQPLTPQEISAGSGRKVWWKCAQGHEWFTSPGNRAGCPTCVRRKFKAGSVSLASKFPALLVEWDFTRNLPLTPDQLTSASKVKVWWLCGAGHSYQSAVQSRTLAGHGCPFCSGRLALEGWSDLATKFPEIAEEWHPTLNGGLQPSDVSPGSSKKVWWLCPRGHAYLTLISSRTGSKKTKCSVCSGRSVSVGTNDLHTTHPSICHLWDEARNEKSVYEVSFGMKTAFWWKCPKGHSYKTNIRRVIDGSPCSICSPSSAQVMTGLNDLATLFPDLLRELHPDLNGDFDAHTVRATSMRVGKLWWICQSGHVYAASLPNRVGRLSGCPFCAERGFGFAAPAVLYLLFNESLGAVKIGITGKGIRTNRLRAFRGAGWDVMRTWDFEVGKAARDIEQKVLIDVRQTPGGDNQFLAKNDMSRLGGHTETFSVELISVSGLESRIETAILRHKTQS